jgi:YD repeat-containing protein
VRWENVVATTNYIYDAANQMTQAVRGKETTAYTYDAKGNLTAKAVNGVTVETYTWDAENRLHGLCDRGVGESGEQESQGVVLSIDLLRLYISVRGRWDYLCHVTGIRNLC